MALSPGAIAPDFIVKDTNGNTVKLTDFAGKRVVLYFYPKDDTPGCTKEACNFRDNYEQYLAKGVAVLGVSVDNEASHQAFASKYNLPFPLLADTDGKIAAAYDVVTERDEVKYAKRVTYVIQSGAIAQVHETVNTATHATDILATLV